ncbi:hypothetical protein DLH72_05085, partial [Candidatus Gracilibacteria bacterium]
PIYFNRKDRGRHHYVIGKSGGGKSVFIGYLARQDVRNGDCIIEWNKDIFKNYDINNFFSENLCYQEKFPTVYNSPKVSIDCSDEKTVEEFKKSPIFSSYQKVEDEYNCYFYFWRQKKQETYKKPELKRCESGQESGKNYENCCQLLIMIYLF